MIDTTNGLEHGVQQIEQFLGYEESESRWIPERELADTCTDLLREYKELLKQTEEMNESPFETAVVDE